MKANRPASRADAPRGARPSARRTIASRAMRYAKEDINTIEELSLRDAYRYEQNITIALSKTEDAREAQLAFIERRPPVFKGR